jgi:hypothetical protein
VRRLSGRNGGATEVALLKGWVYSTIGVNHLLREKLVWVRINVAFSSRPKHLLKTAGGVHNVLRRPDSCLLIGIHAIQNFFPFGLFERRLAFWKDVQSCQECGKVLVCIKKFEAGHNVAPVQAAAVGEELSQPTVVDFSCEKHCAIYRLLSSGALSDSSQLVLVELIWPNGLHNSPAQGLIVGTFNRRPRNPKIDLAHTTCQL